MRLAFLFVFVSITQSLVGQIQSGIIWEDEKYLALPLKASADNPPANLPIRFSLKKYAPKVVNQVGWATSAAWASIWYGQTIAKAASCKEDDPRKITEHAFSPLYVYREANSNGDCFTPVGLTQILELALTSGTPLFNEFNDLCPVEIPDEANSLVSKNRIDGFVKLFNPFDTQSLKVSAIKNALSSGHPVIIGMITPPSFSLAKEFWQAKEQPDTTLSSQALCVIGYDDQKFGGVVQVVNQWGKHWGENGYTWIRYEALARFARYGFELFYSSSCVPFPEASAVIFDDNGKVIDQIDINNQKHKIKRPLKIGTKFRMIVRAKSGFFGYLLVKENRVITLFPTEKVYPYITQSITLPSKEAYYQLEGIPQTNELYVIVSNRQLNLSLLSARIEKERLATANPMDGSRLTVYEPQDAIIKIAVIELEQY